MKKVVYLYSGEGTRSEESSLKLIKTAPSYNAIEEILKSQIGFSIEQLWNDPDIHRCPHSPLLTVISQICLSEIWDRWGYPPDAVIGHSIGELTAAYRAGIYSLEDVLVLTHSIGKVTAQLEGGMAHGVLNPGALDELGLSLAAKNFPQSDGIHITVSGLAEELEAFLENNRLFLKMKSPHPWHHRRYSEYHDQLVSVPTGKTSGPRFVSGVSGQIESTLQKDHWVRWLSGSIDFNKGIETLAGYYAATELEIIEIGFHPVLEQCCHTFNVHTYASSMYRGEDEIQWILYQRRKLDQTPLRNNLDQVIQRYRKDLDYGEALSYQGFSSLTFVEFAALLEPFFPSLAPQDFYRYKTVNQVLENYGRKTMTSVGSSNRSQRHQVVIAGMSCKLPAAVENPVQFWEILRSGEDQVRADSKRGDFEAGFLSEKTSAFDHKFFNLSEAEAKTMDPQQILALELTELLFRDAGLDPELLDRKRVGVYIGAWNDEFPGDPTSAYYPTGTNPSIIASRISYHYDLRGPSWVANTACSSSLVAVHYACKDIEAGRVDYAIAGGVNMILGNRFTHVMRDSGFLSRDQRCKAFDDGANGYVRSEGGGLVLLVKKELTPHYYTEIPGSSINQNGGRAQIITAPHPEAQEELILDACEDARIAPADIAYVECHGTGTKIGDPIEVSALQNSVSRSRDNNCLLGSVKSNVGHLESAAGIAGLLKSVLALYHGSIPANLHFNKTNQYIDFASHQLQVVAEDTPIDKEALIGVSSFGFGGANAHVILKGAGSEKRKELVERKSPFNSLRATPLARYYQIEEKPAAELKTVPSAGSTQNRPEDIQSLVNVIFHELTGIRDIDPELELTDQGLDSLSATQFVTSLQERLGVELDTDLLFEYPLIDQLVAHLEAQSEEGQASLGEPIGQGRGQVERLVKGLFYEITNIKEIDPEIELTDQGMDSLSATHFISQLEAQLKIEIDSDILFEHPLYDQLVDQIHGSLQH